MNIYSTTQITATFSLEYKQVKEREWLKKLGAKWNAPKKEWVLETKPFSAYINVDGENFYEENVHSIPEYVQEFMNTCIGVTKPITPSEIAKNNGVKLTRSEIMKAAHKAAKEMDNKVSYRIRLSDSLKSIYASQK